jgi:long-chain-fatty-acyl-CoA reductase
LEEYRTLLPPARRTFDESARVALTRRAEAFCGFEVLASPDSADWTIAVMPPEAVTEHPLCRTVYVHEVADATDVCEWVDEKVQTVAVAPWERVAEMRDRLARRGVSRIVELGMNNVFRMGGSHDGMQPLSRLVRFVSVERPAYVHGKGMVMSNDQTELLKAGTLRSLIL